jgi:hypothetical protein
MSRLAKRLSLDELLKRTIVFALLLFGLDRTFTPLRQMKER